MNPFRKLITDVEPLNQEIEMLKQTVAELTLEKSNLEEHNKNLSQELIELKNTLNVTEMKQEAVETELEEVVTQVKEIVEEKETVEEVATNKAIEIISSIGVEPVEVTDDEEEMVENTQSVLDQFKSLSGEELNEFFKNNKQEIFKLLKNR